MFNLSAFGVSRALGNFEKTAEALGDRFLQAAAIASAREILPVAAGRAPKLTGGLAGTGKVKAVRRTSAAVQFGSAKVRYAGPTHFGWPARHQRPQPFLFGAGSSMEHKVIQNYEAALGKVVEEEND